MLTASSSTLACKPGPDFYYAESPRVLAQNLMTHAAAVVYAKVKKVWTVPPNASETTGEAQGFAEIEIVDRFKGPVELKVIHTWLRMATCANKPFVSGETRLFALYDQSRERGPDFQYTEIHAWLNPQFIETEVLQELRRLR